MLRPDVCASRLKLGIQQEVFLVTVKSDLIDVVGESERSRRKLGSVSHREIDPAMTTVRASFFTVMFIAIGQLRSIVPKSRALAGFGDNKAIDRILTYRPPRSARSGFCILDGIMSLAIFLPMEFFFCLELPRIVSLEHLSSSKKPSCRHY